MKLKYLGHSCFLIDNLLIDPFLSGNKLCQIKPEEVECEIVCLTHDHQDHVLDAEEVAKRNDAQIVAIFELAQEYIKKGFNAVGMNIGGKTRVLDWEIKMVEAKHSSNLGHPAGFILKHIPSGKRIYHAGDTALFSDMELIAKDVDIFLVPIGDCFTMDIDDAVKAIELVKPKMAIPMHFNTFPPIEQNPEEFRKKSSVVRVLEIGEEIEV